MTRAALIIFALLAGMLNPASAHEVRPAFLELREVSPSTFDIVWKVPARGDMRLSLAAQLPRNCSSPPEPLRSLEGNAYVERWQTVCPGGISGKSIVIDGLMAVASDVLLRIEYLDNTLETQRLTAAKPDYTVRGLQSAFETSKTYFVLGVEHILGGIDHLLFVLALLLLISGWRNLLKTITAFTLAHSITLTGAALGLFSLPQAPVEIAIALSIVFVAVEAVKRKAGAQRLAERSPWVIAFLFGLLHGFGFAGALQEIGLPQKDVPLALLSFNLGVEAGQVVFVSVVLVIARLAARLSPVSPVQVHRAAAYIIGIAASYWLLERLQLAFG